MVTNTRFLPVLLSVCIAVETYAQTSQIVPWNDGDLSDQSGSVNAFHPEPVIFVHGIAASRVRWQDVIAHLHSDEWFTAYHYREDLFIAAKESTAAPQEDYAGQELSGNFPATEKNQWRDIEQPYLHTFNYGRHAKRLPNRTTRPWTRVRPNRQTHDLVEWNAWAVPDNDYLQGRTTLNQRIDQIRLAYEIPGQPRPNVLLISHSLGGMVVSEYLMSKNADLGVDPYVPVRRSVAINSFFWGSPLANVLANFDDNWFNPYTDILLENLLKAGSGVASSPFAVWVENRNGVNWQAITVDLEDAVAKSNIPPIQTSHFLTRGGPFRERIRSTPFPVTTEFVTSGSRLPEPDLTQVGARVFLGRNTAYHDIKTVFEGDGMLPFNTMAGYNSNGTPAFVNLAPVDIRGYLVDTNACSSAINWFASHGNAPGKVGIYPHLLDGLQYITGPRPERLGDWSGLQKQYTNSPVQAAAGTTFTHTDEPGIAALHLLYIRTPTENPARIPSLDTWIISNGVPQKIPVADQRFEGRQIIGRSTDQSLAVQGVTGTKNRSQNPVGIHGTNYWVAAGNEYLPSSLSIQFRSDLTPLPIATSTNALSTASRIVTNCLVQLDANDEPEFQYGFFHTNGVSIVNARTNYIAAQGFNLAGLLTPQAERAFDVPVLSSNVVAILRGINQREAMSTNCLVANDPARWTARVDEWVTVNTNTLQFALNFFPTNFPSVATNNIVRDAWTGTPYADWVYVESNKTVVITNATTASSQFLVSYDAFLGTATGFTNAYSGSITNFFAPALQDDTLAGVPATLGLLGQIRTALDAVIPKFLDPATTNCVPWTKTNLVARLHPDIQPPPTDWLPVNTGLITAAHFLEMQDALDLLNLTADCMCGGEIGDPMCGGQSDASGDCGLCTDCVPPSMTVVVTGGSVAGTYVLPYTQCGDPQFGGGVAWGDGGMNSIRKAFHPNCGPFAGECNTWQVSLSKGCPGYWSDLSSFGSACDTSPVVFPNLGGVATAGPSAACEDATCGGTAASSYTLVVTGQGCLDGTYVLTRTYCVGGSINYSLSTSAFYMTLDYWDGFGWGLSISGAPPATFSAYTCYGPSSCGQPVDLMAQQGFTVDSGDPVTSIVVTPAACALQPYTVECETETLQCPLCAGQGVGEPSSFNAKINTRNTPFDICPDGGIRGAFNMALNHVDSYNNGHDSYADCGQCNYQFQSSRQSVYQWTWLVNEGEDVPLCFNDFTPWSNVSTLPIGPDTTCQMPDGFGKGATCQYRSTSPVAIVYVAGLDEFGDPIESHPCYPAEGIPVYLNFYVFGKPVWDPNGIGQPHTVYGAQMSLVDINNVIWGGAGATAEGCCKPCASKWHFCGGYDESHCELGWGTQGGCGLGSYYDESYDFSWFDVLVEPCGDCSSP